MASDDELVWAVEAAARRLRGHVEHDVAWLQRELSDDPTDPDLRRLRTEQLLGYLKLRLNQWSDGAPL